jgi:cytochrome c-type biogenesis protein CcmH/NrfG
MWQRPRSQRLIFVIAAFVGLVGQASALHASQENPAVTPADPRQLEEERRSDMRLFEAETYLEEKNPAAAIPILEEILADNPGRIDVWKVLAGAYQMWVAGSPDAPDELVGAAVAAYRTVLDREPGDRLALEGLRMLSSRYATPVEETLKSRTALESWKAGEADFQRQASRPENEERDYETVINAYRFAIREEPRHPRMYIRLAQALELSGIHTAEVRGLYTTALRMDPANITALNALAAIEMNTGRVDEAGRLLKIAFELIEQEAPGYEAAEATITRERLGKVLDELAERNPTPGMHYYLGRLHLVEGNHGEAVKALKRPPISTRPASRTASTWRSPVSSMVT